MRHCHIRSALLCGLLLSSAAAAGAQEIQGALQSRRTMTAMRLADEEAIVLDGVLDEPVWQRTEPARDFIQQDPVNGGTPTERTEVRIVFDRENLYMGVTNYDSEPDKLLGNTMKRDEFLRADDRFMWVFDTFLDARSGYFFEMNPSGLMADALMGPTGPTSREWDGIWNARVRRSEIGWTIEIEIPFRTLSFDPDAPAWGVNFQRTIRRKNEENLWTGHAYNQGLWRLSNAGLLTGISGVSQGIGLDLKPYTVGTIVEAPGTDEPQDLTTTGDVGLDVFYNLTPQLRANLTINTDFAQTEVDQRLVNLTRFPLFFPEKRDFFLEQANFLDFYSVGGRGPGGPPQVRPYFSRRIGLAEGEPQPITVGLKLTGQVGGQDIGLLQVRTGEEGTLPAEDFTVLRVRRRLLTQSYVGALYTRRDASGTVDPSLHTAGVDFRLATSTFRETQNLDFSGFFLHTTNPLETGRSQAYGLSLQYPNDLWSGGISFQELQENYDPAVGFVRRTGIRSYEQRVEFSPRPPNHPYLRQISFSAGLDVETDMQNRLLTRQISASPLQLNFHSQENVRIWISRNYERLDEDFEIHEGIVLPIGGEYEYNRANVFASTANRRLVAVRGRVGVGGFFSGDRQELELGMSVRPARGVVLELEGEWNRIDLAEGEFDTRVYRFIADTQFSPWIWLSNNVQFDSVSGIVGWQSRFRWTLSPGDDLYLVYLHNWQDDPLDPLDRFHTRDRRASTKFIYTHRF